MWNIRFVSLKFDDIFILIMSRIDVLKKIQNTRVMKNMLKLFKKKPFYLRTLYIQHKLFIISILYLMIYIILGIYI